MWRDKGSHGGQHWGLVAWSGIRQIFSGGDGGGIEG